MRRKTSCASYQCGDPRTACGRAFGPRAVGHSDRYLAGRRSLRIAGAIADSHYVLT